MIKPIIHVAIGIIQNTYKEFLVALRPLHLLGGGYWEFPGGKIELGEDANNALSRELKEEVGIEVIQSQFLMECEYDYPERKVVLHAYYVEQYLGIPIGLEGQQIRWVVVSELRQIGMLPANRPILEALENSSSRVTGESLPRN